MNTRFGSLIIAIGILAVIVGLVVWSGGFSWFGNLPGDFRIERENFSVYIPLVSMLIVTVVLNLILYFVRRVFERN
jgi:uncharacterized membrane protein YidH (DUF202 family)